MVNTPSSYTTGPNTNIAIDTPLIVNFAADRFTIGGGVAIFHVASGRVVICHHSRDKYYFLPKGRRDVGESTAQGAEREGFEESGYRNRVLPLPLRHRQPQPRIPLDPRISSLSTEPVFCQLYPQTPSSQYICFWYISETVPPSLESSLNALTDAAEETNGGISGAPYQYPEAYPVGLGLGERIQMDRLGGGSGGGIYEPVRHENMGLDPEEALYESELVEVGVALERLKWNPVMVYVVKMGWEGIRERMRTEG